MIENKIKIYIGESLPNIRILPILEKKLDIESNGNRLFRGIFKQTSFSFFDITKNPEDADFFMIPHDYFNVHERENYIADFVRLSRKYSKKLLLFIYGDTDEKVNIPNSIILRTSQYRYKLSENEIIMPAYAEDLLFNNALKLRNKNSKPTVGFCGWADLSNLLSKLKFWVKILIQNIKKGILLDKYAEVHKQGIFFRKKLIKILQQSPKIKTNFIIRKTYSGHKKTIELPENQARSEYIKNILDSDFILCVKGDGNWSYRFYESLSLGRLPILLDTEITLPLEGKIDYNRFIVRIPSNELFSIESKINSFYDSLSNSEYKKRQQEARRAFENYLRIDSFLKITFESIAKRTENS